MRRRVGTYTFKVVSSANLSNYEDATRGGKGGGLTRRVNLKLHRGIDDPVLSELSRATLNPGHGAAKCNSPESKHPDEIVFSEHVVALHFMTDEFATRRAC